MAHEHNIVDSDKTFIINPATRAIENPSGKVTLIQYDHNSERFGFSLPRFVEGHDMADSTSIQIHYINIGSGSENNAGVYGVTDAAADPDNPEKMKFSWLVSSNCTQLVGSLSFAVRFSCVKNGITEYSWGTSAFSGMTISTSIQNTETVVQEHADIIAAWEARISEIEKSNGFPSGGTEGQVLTADAEGNAVWADIEIPESVTSWNDLEDRPFGEEIMEVAIVPEVATYHNGGLGVNVSLDAEKIYKVVFDGVEYECVVKSQNTGYMQMYRLGNPKVIASGLLSDSNENFCVEFGEYLPGFGTGAMEVKLYVANELRGVEHTVAVYGVTKTIVQIDEKYIPEGFSGSWNDLTDRPFWESEPVEKIVLESFTDTYSSDNGMWNTGDLPLFDLVRGATYTVLWDDVAYECVAVDDGYGGEALGNFAVVIETPDSGEPFFICEEYNGERRGICAKEAGTHTISIKANLSEIHTLDRKYLPMASDYDIGVVSFSAIEQAFGKHIYINEEPLTYGQTKNIKRGWVLCSSGTSVETGSYIVMNISTTVERINNVPYETYIFDCVNNSVFANRSNFCRIFIRFVFDSEDSTVSEDAVMDHFDIRLQSGFVLKSSTKDSSNHIRIIAYDDGTLATKDAANLSDVNVNRIATEAYVNEMLGVIENGTY